MWRSLNNAWHVLTTQLLDFINLWLLDALLHCNVLNLSLKIQSSLLVSLFSSFSVLTYWYVYYVTSVLLTLTNNSFLSIIDNTNFNYVIWLMILLIITWNSMHHSPNCVWTVLSDVFFIKLQWNHDCDASVRFSLMVHFYWLWKSRKINKLCLSTFLLHVLG